MHYLDRYEALLQKQQVNYLRFGDLILREYNQIIIPLGPIINQNKGININSKKVFAKLNGKLLWWSHPNKDVNDQGWYGVIKDKHIEVDDYSNSNLRRKVRKGLTTFEIKIISPQFLIDNGLSIYMQVEKQNNKKFDSTKFVKQIESYKRFEDIVNIWGIFYEDELVGYCIVLLYDKMEANISEIKIIDSYKKQYASYALFHMLDEYYLKEQVFKYISDGYRTLLHDSGIQVFLIKNFGFKKAGLHLEIALRFPWNVVINCLYPFRSTISISSVAAVLNLLAIYKNQKRLPK